MKKWVRGTIVCRRVIKVAHCASIRMQQIRDSNVNFNHFVIDPYKEKILTISLEVQKSLAKQDTHFDFYVKNEPYALFIAEVFDH